MLAANAVADRVEAAVSRDHLAGFAGDLVSPSLSHPGVTVYFHGEVPVMLRRLAAAAATARASGSRRAVIVRFRSAPYSLAQLLLFRAEINGAPGFARAGITAILIYPQATGLWIGVAHGSARARSLPVIARSKIPVHFFAASIPAFRVIRPFWSYRIGESAGRHIKADDLDLRPVFHRLERRVKGHVLICMLAAYLTWHLRQAWAPLTYTDEEPAAQANPVAPAAARPPPRPRPLSSTTPTAGPTAASAACSPTWPP